MSGTNKDTGNKIDCECASVTKSKDTCKNITHPLRYYEFTQDEIKALEECDKESFYRRCLPFSTLFATATYAAVKYGYMSKHRHFGAVPKMLFAILLGHACGRVAYMKTCHQTLREELPNNSPLGNLLRKYHREAQAELCLSKKK